jgi:hypothetical protein
MYYLYSIDFPNGKRTDYCPRPWTGEYLERIRKLLTEGKTRKQIQEELKLSKPYIRNLVLRAV